jgi:hypothetical protein
MSVHWSVSIANLWSAMEREILFWNLDVFWYRPLLVALAAGGQI